MTDFLKPMLCHDAAGTPLAVPEGPDWIIERKYDGWRFLFHARADGVRSYAGRNGTDHTGGPAAIERAMAAALPVDSVVDCELIVPGQHSAVVSSALAHPLGYELVAVAFDVVRLAGHDIRGLPWSDRRRLLERVLFAGPSVILSEVQPNDQAIYERWLDEGQEGAVAKRTTGLYHSGRRSWDTLKLKPSVTAEAVIIGFKPGKDGIAGQIGAFEIRMLDSDAETGVKIQSAELMDQALHDPDSLLGKTIEIAHWGIYEGGQPRHPQFRCFRPDRDSAAV